MDKDIDMSDIYIYRDVGTSRYMYMYVHKPKKFKYDVNLRKSILGTWTQDFGKCSGPYSTLKSGMPR